MARKAAKISKEEFAAKFYEEFGKLDGLGDILNGEGAFKKAAADLKKCEFDLENWDLKPAGQIDEFLGPQQIGDLGCVIGHAGGDWEHPVCFVFYLDQDGKTIRAYIPEAGNPWNTATKQAYGNDEEADDKNIRKQLSKFKPELFKMHSGDKDSPFESDDADILFDKNLMFAEIAEHIEVVGEPKAKAKSLKEIAKEAKDKANQPSAVLDALLGGEDERVIASVPEPEISDDPILGNGEFNLQVIKADNDIFLRMRKEGPFAQTTLIRLNKDIAEALGADLLKAAKQ